LLLQLPNVLGFTFGVIQMGLYAIYRNATPRVPAKGVADDKEDIVKVPEHVVTIAKLGAPAAAELNTHEVHPVTESPPMDEEEEAAKPKSGIMAATEKVKNKGGNNNADQV
jgi:solute carrier family 50 protein (sugar transporter)